MKSKILVAVLVLTEVLRALSDGTINKKFPSDFLFGAATSSYQVEGGWNSDGKGENIWDNFTHSRPYLIFLGQNGDISCDSYHKYLEDVQLLKHLNVTHYRFSLSWSRILPTGLLTNINQPGVAYYNSLIKALKKNGIEPFITLYHWDLPQPLQDIGGWLNQSLVNHFADYATLAFTLFGDNVRYWTTFNEPRATCQNGYGYGVFPPGEISNGIDSYLCAHTILKAHARAYHIYNESFKPKHKGKLTMVLDTDWFEPDSESARDQEAAERKRQFVFGWFANPIFKGNYPQVMIDRIAARSKLEGFEKSRLPEFTQEEIKYINGTYDFLALNTYTTNLVKWKEDFVVGYPSWDADISVEAYADPAWNSAASIWLKVVPWGMRKLLNWLDRTYNHPEIIITENGYSDFGQLDDRDRSDYLKSYLSNVLQAIVEDKINVKGYTVWSLLDNFEWNMAYSVKFGLYHVDFKSANRTRTIKKSADYYKKVINTKCLVDVCVD